MKAYQFNHAVRWIISYITVLIIFISCAAYILYEPPIEEIDRPSTIIFSYPMIDPEFLKYENIIVCYEFIDENRHLIAVDNNGKEYILPLFKDRDSAIDFMNSYFIYLMELEK